MNACAWLIQMVPENVFNLTLTAATVGLLNTSKQSDEVHGTRHTKATNMRFSSNAS